MKNYKPIIKGFLKIVDYPNYHYIFNLKNGFFARWGENKAEDPQFSPLGPELLDMEVSTICSGNCPWCYKANISQGKNMTFETFKTIFDKIPKNLTQIAFGIGDLDANPDLWKMFQYCLKNRVIPSITINGYKINTILAEKLVKYCGAVAVSHYDDNFCFNAINLLSEKGLKQINIHKLIARETLESCYDLINKVKNDSRLKKLNAIVFLSLKKKGRGINFHTLSLQEFSDLVHYTFKQGVPIGFDSCSANKFLKVIKDHKNRKMLEMMTESCESTCFSQYINVVGKAFPCSFLEGEKGYKGINMLTIKNFLKEVWFEPSIVKFRQILIENGRNCPHFSV
jgi:MoaA/NifB/PqqE/SkfB family radical SAM enzyme